MSDQAMPPEMMWQTIKDLRAEVERLTNEVEYLRPLADSAPRLRAALEKIRDMDYRGNRHPSASIAREALENKNG